VLYTLIFDANERQIGNPKPIFPGQVLTAPRQTTN
jgi:nucleoid-associated protein YgaU|tara:strand:+ start:519 stop:623 length:105 start_codon:yes stop_codon:yes gene_type:complete